MEDFNYTDTYNDVNKTTVLFSKTPNQKKLPVACKCSKCGKEFDEWDERNDFLINHIPSYGSIYDGERIQIRLCCKCMDDFFESILKDFLSDASISPLASAGDAYTLKQEDLIDLEKKISERESAIDDLRAYESDEDVAAFLRAWRVGHIKQIGE